MAPARGSWLVPAVCKSMWVSSIWERQTHHRLHLLRPSPLWRHAQVTMLCVEVKRRTSSVSELSPIVARGRVAGKSGKSEVT